MNKTYDAQTRAVHYYNRFSKVYDWISSKHYYHKARKFAVEQLALSGDQRLLNLPCGTGQNFEYFQLYMNNQGLIIGIDLSEGMLGKAAEKIKKKNWNNIILKKADARFVGSSWLDEEFDGEVALDAILCDLGLSGFPEWEKIIDNLIGMLKPGGRMVIMDWYIKNKSLRGAFIKWIGKGEVDRPVWQYLKSKIDHFELNQSFKGGDLFVASGTK